MQVVKRTENYAILKRKDGRYAVRGAGRVLIHGEEKARILAAEGLIQLSEAKPKAPEPAEDEGATPAGDTPPEDSGAA